MRGERGAPPPFLDFLLDGDIHIRPRDDQFDTARHETFHTVQVLYASFGDYKDRNAYWWGEATANWATHTYQPPAQQAAEDSYQFHLPAFLGRPNRDPTLVEESGIAWVSGFARRAEWNGCCKRKSQYGAFVLADWLEAAYGDAGNPKQGQDVILRTWEELAKPDRRDTLEAIADAVGLPLSDIIFDFHTGSYLLEHQGVEIDDRVADWRGRLQGSTMTDENKTVGNSFGFA